MRLVDLSPSWVVSGGEGITRDGQPVPERHGVGVTCHCPCGCDLEMYVPFDNPVDGGPSIQDRPTWHRTGETFETLTLTPSIKRNRERGGCGWHGFITNGNITGQVE